MPDLSRPPDGGVVVGHSRHRGSDDAVLVAADLARRLGVPLHVLHVLATEDFPVDPDAWDWEREGERAVAEQEAAVRSLLAGSGVTWDREVLEGDPATVLARVAEAVDAPFVVVGTHGEGRVRLGSALLGHRSVSHGAVARGHRPVLVVPEGARSPSSGTWAPAAGTGGPRGSRRTEETARGAGR